MALVSLALAATSPLVKASPEASTAEPTLDLASLQGKVVYLDFWASWCGPCRQSFPWMNDVQRDFAKDGLVVVGVNVDHDRADADQFLKTYRPSFQIVFDPQGALAERWQVKGMPTSVLIGRDGKPIAVFKGFHSKDRADLEQAIRAALAH